MFEIQIQTPSDNRNFFHPGSSSQTAARTHQLALDDKMPGSHPRPFGIESRRFNFFFFFDCSVFFFCVWSSTPHNVPDLSSPTRDGTHAPAGVLTTGPPERVLIEFFKLSPVVPLHKEGWEHRAGADSLGNTASSNNNHHLHRCFFLRCFMGEGQAALLHQVGFPVHF